MIQEGDVGGAQYLRAHPEAVQAVHFPDPDIFRDVDRPTYDERMSEQLATAQSEHGDGDLAALLRSTDTWTISD